MAASITTTPPSPPINLCVHKSCIITKRFPFFNFQCCTIYSALELQLILLNFSGAEVLYRLVIKTFEKDSRPRPRPWSPGLETKSKTLGNRSRDQDQDLGQQVSRPRPRPWSPGLETKTKTLVIRSRDQDPIFHQALNGHSCKLRT